MEEPTGDRRVGLHPLAAIGAALARARDVLLRWECPLDSSAAHGALNERRENDIVRNLLDAGGGVLILGAAHDPADNIKAQSDGECEYARSR